MIVSSSNLRSSRQPRPWPAWLRKTLWVLLLLVVIGAAGWCAWLWGQIRYYETHGSVEPSDAIVVFGAAEYDGRPSPVLRARLDHALTLYQRGLAPMIITLGGSGGDVHSEGAVGHDYLRAHGVPEESIIAETQSGSTTESSERLAVIAHANGFQRILAVSDGTHLFRIRAICTSYGLDVFVSPRPQQRPPSWRLETRRIWHEIVSYTAWRLHLH